MNLTVKKALVTEAGTGIGQAAAIELARLGQLLETLACPAESSSIW